MIYSYNMTLPLIVFTTRAGSSEHASQLSLCPLVLCLTMCRPDPMCRLPAVTPRKTKKQGFTPRLHTDSRGGVAAWRLCAHGGVGLGDSLPEHPLQRLTAL